MLKTLITACLLVLAFPVPDHAFLSAAAIVIVGSAVTPFLAGFLAVITVNLIIFYKHIPKFIWAGLILFTSAIIIIVLVWLVSKRYQKLQTNNQIGASLDVANINKENEWDKLLNLVNQSPEPDSQRKVTRQDGSYCYNRNSTYISSSTEETLSSIIESKEYKILDVSCPSITVKNGIKACGLSWDLFINLENEDSVNKLMNKFRINKNDKVLLLCEFGVTSSHLSYILNHYGYQTVFGSLLEVDPKLLDIPKGESFQDATVLIDDYKFEDDDKYLYVLINDRDRDPFYPSSPDNISGDLKNFALINSTKLPLGYEEDKELIPFVRQSSGIDASSVKDYKIVCKNKLHCFLTRHFLYSKRITDYENLYCLQCKKEVVVNYCDEK